MDSSHPLSKLAASKVHVVYYLSRGGHMEHPHLIEGLLQPSQDGLRLKDFKRWLAVLRGTGVPNSFSWSCKRSYKSGYIWHDLSDDDLVLPVYKNEYVLMGSEIRDVLLADSCKCGCSKHLDNLGRKQASEECQLKLREVHQQDQSKVSPKTKSESAHTSRTEDGNSPFSLSSPCSEDNRTLKIRHNDAEVTTECELETGTVSEELPSSAKTKGFVQSEVKVYKAMATDQATDAATQTGESKRCSTEEPPPLQLSSFLANSSGSRSSSACRNASVGAKEAHSCSIRESIKSELLFSPSSIQSTVPENSPGSAKSARSINSSRLGSLDHHHYQLPPPRSAKMSSSSQMVKQLLSCGSVDINESSIFNLKSLSVHPPPAGGAPREPISKSWLCKPCGSSCISDNRSVSGMWMDGTSIKEVMASSPESIASKKGTERSSSMSSRSCKVPVESEQVLDASSVKALQMGFLQGSVHDGLSIRKVPATTSNSRGIHHGIPELNHFRFPSIRTKVMECNKSTTYSHPSSSPRASVCSFSDSNYLSDGQMKSPNGASHLREVLLAMKTGSRREKMSVI